MEDRREVGIRVVCVISRWRSGEVREVSEFAIPIDETEESRSLGERRCRPSGEVMILSVCDVYGRVVWLQLYVKHKRKCAVPTFFLFSSADFSIASRLVSHFSIVLFFYPSQEDMG